MNVITLIFMLLPAINEFRNTISIDYTKINNKYFDLHFFNNQQKCYLNLFYAH